MPADPSHNPGNRRASRKLTIEEEVDSRRARGEVFGPEWLFEAYLN